MQLIPFLRIQLALSAALSACLAKFMCQAKLQKKVNGYGRAPLWRAIPQPVAVPVQWKAFELKHSFKCSQVYLIYMLQLRGKYLGSFVSCCCSIRCILYRHPANFYPNGYGISREHYTVLFHEPTSFVSSLVARELSTPTNLPTGHPPTH